VQQLWLLKIKNIQKSKHLTTSLGALLALEGTLVQVGVTDWFRNGRMRYVVRGATGRRASQEFVASVLLR
jgi:hypothetical protein